MMIIAFRRGTVPWIASSAALALSLASSSASWSLRAGESGRGSEGKSGGTVVPKKTIPGVQFGKESPGETRDPLAVAMSLFCSEVKKTIIKEEGTVGSLAIKVDVAPDAYSFQLSEGYLTLRSQGHTGENLMKKIRALHRSSKANKGKPLFRISFSGTENYFISKDVNAIFKLRSPSIRKTSLVGMKPALKFETWKVIESASAVDSYTLAHFRTLSLDAIATWRDLRREPIKLTVGGIAAQSMSLDRHNSVNLEARQISCDDWKKLILPAKTFTFKPDEWKIPEIPKAIEELLEAPNPLKK